MIADLKPYSEYKYSGLPWLGDLPAHWDTRRAKRFLREVDERSQTGQETLLSVSHLTGVTPRSEKTVTMFLAKSNVGYKVCRPGDVVINTLWAWMAALGVTKYAGIVSPAYGVYRPLAESGLLPQFADQLLRTPRYAGEYLRRSTGVNSSRMRLYPDQFLRIPVVYPPPAEQAAIVRFLDHTNREFDRYIRAKRKLIARLNDQKQAIIHRAVTRGLDANVSLRPSGVPWLGDIPEHWGNAVKLKYISSLKGRLGWQGLKAGEYTDYGPYVVSSAHFKDQRIEWSKCPHVTQERYDMDVNIQLSEGDILIMKDGAAMGKLAFVDHLPDAACLNSHVLLFRPLIRDGRQTYDPRYVFYFMSTGPFQNYVQVNATGATFLGISQWSLGNYIICLPPIDEQRAIARFIDTEIAGLRKVMSKVETQIAALVEYRTRLVADVVTGKFDIRGAVAKLPDRPQESACISDDLPDELDFDETPELAAEEAEA